MQEGGILLNYQDRFKFTTLLERDHFELGVVVCYSSYFNERSVNQVEFVSSPACNSTASYIPIMCVGGYVFTVDLLVLPPIYTVHMCGNM